MRLTASERSTLMTMRVLPKELTSLGLVGAESVTITLPACEVVRYLTTLNLNMAHGYQQYWNHTPTTIAEWPDYEPVTIVVREFNNSLLTTPLMGAVIIAA